MNQIQIVQTLVILNMSENKKERETRCRAWVYLAPAGRHVYSRAIGTLFQAPEGRHVPSEGCKSYCNQPETSNEF